MKDIDPRPTRAGVRNLPDDEFFWILMEPAWDDSMRGTSGQRVLASATYFIRDVDNGGLEQALWNREPSEVNEVLEGFDRLGAAEHAAAIRTALEMLLGSDPPRTREERCFLIDQKTRAWLDEQIEPLNRRLYGEQQLWPYYRRYIEAHPDQFFRD